MMIKLGHSQLLRLGLTRWKYSTTFGPPSRLQGFGVWIYMHADISPKNVVEGGHLNREPHRKGCNPFGCSSDDACVELKTSKRENIK